VYPIKKNSDVFVIFKEFKAKLELDQERRSSV